MPNLSLEQLCNRVRFFYGYSTLVLSPPPEKIHCFAVLHTVQWKWLLDSSTFSEILWFDVNQITKNFKLVNVRACQGSHGCSLEKQLWGRSVGVFKCSPCGVLLWSQWGWWSIWVLPYSETSAVNQTPPGQTGHRQVFIRLQWTVSRLPHQEGLGAEETLYSQWVPEWSGKCSIMFPKLEWSLLLAQAEPGLSSQNKYKALLNPPNDNTNHVEQKMSCVPYSGCRGLRVLSWFSHPNLPVGNTAFPQFASTQ